HLVDGSMSQNEVDSVAGKVQLEPLEKSAVVGRPFARAASSSQLACRDVETLKQFRGATTNVVSCPALQLPGPGRQRVTLVIWSLKRCLRIRSQRQHALGWVDVQTQQILNASAESGIVGQLEALPVVRPESQRAPDPRNGALAQPCGGCDRACAPHSLTRRHRIKGQIDDPLNVRLADTLQRSPACGVRQTFDPMLHEALPRAADRRP